VTWEMATKVWWCIAWRVVFFGVPAIAAVTGMVVGIYGRGPLTAPVSGVLGFWVSVAISIAAVKSALGKEFTGFSIRLVRMPS
jgi:hypothetical protein